MSTSSSGRASSRSRAPGQTSDGGGTTRGAIGERPARPLRGRRQGPRARAPGRIRAPRRRAHRRALRRRRRDARRAACRDAVRRLRRHAKRWSRRSQASGELRAGSGAAIGRVQTAIAVKAGAPIPAIDSADALRAALLAADALYFPDATRSTAGAHVAAMLDRLGLREALAPRLRMYANGATAMRALAEEAERARSAARRRPRSATRRESCWSARWRRRSRSPRSTARRSLGPREPTMRSVSSICSPVRRARRCAAPADSIER